MSSSTGTAQARPAARLCAALWLIAAAVAGTDLRASYVPQEAGQDGDAAAFGAAAAAQDPALGCAAAAEYVIGKFAEHDIVLLGEMHYVRQNLDFLIELVPRLYAAGIHHLGWEFAHHEDQAKIDALLNAPDYDEELAHTILLNWNVPARLWAFREYLDVLRAAWEVNRELPAGARPFRVVALGMPDRPQDRSVLKPGEHPLDPAVRNRMLGAHFYDAVNIFWAQVINREFIARGVPALIYSGAGHTYTRFFHDRRRDHTSAPSPDPRRGIAAGNLIYNQIGDRAFHINLHGTAGVGATLGVEALMRESAGAPARGIGFDLAGTRFGDVPVTDMTGYREGRSSGFTLADLADRYVFLATVGEWEPVAVIDGFINDRTRHTVQMSLADARPEDPPLTVEEVEARAAEELRSRFDALVGRFQDSRAGPGSGGERGDSGSDSGEVGAPANVEWGAIPADTGDGDIPIVPLQDDYLEEISRLADRPEVRRALDWIERTHEQTVRDQIRLTEVPAPPFEEEQRAEVYADALREAGADTVYRDAVGNVIALRRGVTGDSAVIVSGHLDTVFPEGTDVAVTQRGDTLFAPGIMDDGRGLAALLAVLRALDETGIRTRDDIVFLGTVGEEGLGDLRGMKHYFRDGRGSARAFITVDTDDEGGIVHQAIGSRRYRITIRGPGGHSWSAFGRANPLHALGSAMHHFVEAADPFTRTEGPRATYNVGRTGGGTSINSIPAEAWIEVDLRSEDQDRLAELDALLGQAVERAVAEHNDRRREGAPLEAELDPVGDRPPGLTDPTDPLVQRAAAAYAWSGLKPKLTAASTDANVPKSLGIPAIGVSGGGIGGNTHSTDEWWADEGGAVGIQRVLLLVLAHADLP